MRLERLEIAGFKSFSDRSELAFDRGVTAIVGPNGCGKSNVVDAVRWVLGETRPTSMRGGEMTDVIFKGSASRPALRSARRARGGCACASRHRCPSCRARSTGSSQRYASSRSQLRGHAA